LHKPLCLYLFRLKTISMKRAEILIVEDKDGKVKIDDKKLNEILNRLEKVDRIVVNKITLPLALDEDSNNLTGIHVIVREVAET